MHEPSPQLPRTWSTYFMGFAEHASTRSTCPRKAVGAVLIADKHVIATGYNGAPTGMLHCVDVGCDLRRTSCTDIDNDQYATIHCIRTVHAEANALLQAAQHGHAVKGTILYTTASPCRACMMLILAARIGRVVWREPYRVDTIRDLIIGSGIEHDQLNKDGFLDKNPLMLPFY